MKANRVEILSAVVFGVIILAVGVFFRGFRPKPVRRVGSGSPPAIRASFETNLTRIRANMPGAPVAALAVSPGGRGPRQFNPGAESAPSSLNLSLVLREFQVNPPATGVAPTQPPSSTPGATATPKPTSTPTPTATSTATPTPTATATDTPTSTATATDTPTPTDTSTPTATATPVLPSLLNADFDQGHVAWTEDSPNFSGNMIVQQGTDGAPDAYSGLWLAWLGGLDNETGDLHQQITIPNDAGPTYLYFYYQMSTLDTNCNAASPSDIFYLAVDSTFVSGYVICETYNTGAVWTSLAFPYDLSNYAGQTVNLHLIVTTDGALTSSMYFDSLSFQDLPPAQLRSSGGLPALPAPSVPGR